MDIKFGKIKEYSTHKSKKIPLETPEGEQIIIKVNDCFSWGFQPSRFVGAQLSLVLDPSQTEFLQKLNSIKEKCTSFLIENGYMKPDDKRNIMSSLYNKKEDRNPTLYLKVMDDTYILQETETGKKKSTIENHKYSFNANTVITVDNIHISENGKISIQFKLRVVLILKPKKQEEDEEYWTSMV